MMYNEEEKRCPLCTEEMDWTDQQFMPCKCGYQVCVWCFHHIMDMAEKDETEGRCPACRTIYEKEKVVALQANCGRTRAKTSSRKAKPPKALKATKVKKDLTNVRVIQRRMAYVIGLPLSLADEDVLQRKEYLGQYGKVTKISLSRTAGGTIQQFINGTCSVYITYSKEEEALRCIQSVHGFVLEGKLLRASFGTAKYCHAWLKSMPCNNQSCLYLHSIGAEEDSFGKDEVAAVHTRNRVDRIVGSEINMTKRSGRFLPPPADVYKITSTFSNKSTWRGGIFDAAHGSVNSNCDITRGIRSKDTDGVVAVPEKMTTFVDIIGRSNIATPGKDENDREDGRILDLCSCISSVKISEYTYSGEPFSVPTPCKVSSADKFDASLVKNTTDEPLREYSSSSDIHGSKDTYGSCLGELAVHPSYSAYPLEDSSSPLNRSPNSFTLDPYRMYNSEDEASLPVECVNSVLNETFWEMDFRSSAKLDRIRKSSLSFSNEEIVEQLRRIDDDSLVSCEENSVLAVVESSIISNIMSIDFDSCDDSSRMPHDLSEMLDDTDGLGGSSWSSLNSDQSGYSTCKQDTLVGHVVGSLLPEYGDIKELYPSKSQRPVTRAQSSTPPGFSLRPRCPPPGFSSTERPGYLPRSTSVSCLANTSLYPNTLSQPSSARINGSIHNFDSNPATSFKHLCSETSAAKLTSFEEESKLWLRMQQSPSVYLDCKFSPTFSPHTPPQELSYSPHKGPPLPGLDRHQKTGDPSILLQTNITPAEACKYAQFYYQRIPAESG